MSALIEKIRRARESQVEVNGLKFTVRRPTDLEMAEITKGQLPTQGDILEKFVTGWEGVKEVDIAPGGTGELVKFERDLFLEFVSDRPDLWAPLVNEVVSKYRAHQEQLEQTAKN